MSHRSFGAALIAAFAMSGALAAQNTPPAASDAKDQQTTAQLKNVTVEGCLVRESDVPGRKPNVAERAGVMEDFILTDAKILTSGVAGATGTSGGAAAEAGGGAKMFEVRGIESDELKKYLGQRVQVDGKLDPKDLGERRREMASPGGEAAGDLPEIQAAKVTKSASTQPCPPVK